METIEKRGVENKTMYEALISVIRETEGATVPFGQQHSTWLATMYHYDL